MHIRSGDSCADGSSGWQPSSPSESKPLSCASAICDGPAHALQWVVSGKLAAHEMSPQYC